MTKKTRRSVLSMLGGIGSAVLAGCSGSSNESPPQSETVTQSTQTATEAQTESLLPIELEESDIPIKKNNYYHQKYNVPEEAKMTYEVSSDSNFDVYVFKDEFNGDFEIYKDYIAGEKVDNHPDGMPGISDEYSRGKAETTSAALTPNTYHFVVDYSDYGGHDAAGIDDDSPDKIIVDIGMEIEKLSPF